MLYRRLLNLTYKYIRYLVPELINSNPIILYQTNILEQKLDTTISLGYYPTSRSRSYGQLLLLWRQIALIYPTSLALGLSTLTIDRLLKVVLHVIIVVTQLCPRKYYTGLRLHIFLINSRFYLLISAFRRYLDPRTPE